MQRCVLLVLTALLAATIAAVSGVSAGRLSQNFVWNRNTDWRNMHNWFNNTMPTAGSIVTFPESFSKFAADSCTGSTYCKKGGTVSLRPLPSENAVTVTVSAIQLPLQGKLQLFDGASIALMDDPEGADPVKVSFSDMAESNSIDFLCANNWVRVLDHWYAILVANTNLPTYLGDSRHVDQSKLCGPLLQRQCDLSRRPLIYG